MQRLQRMAPSTLESIRGRPDDRGPVVALAHDVADRIVEWAVANWSAAGVTTDISVALPSARVIASTVRDRIGGYHPLAQRAVATGDVVEAEGELEAGVSSPLTYDDTVVGAVVLHGDMRRGREIIRIVRTLAELLIYQAAVIDRLPDQERLRDKLLAELLHGQLQANSGSPPIEAAIIGIDLHVPRIVASVDVAAIVESWGPVRPQGDVLSRFADADRRERARAELLWRARRLRGGREADVWGFADERWLVLLAVADPADLEADRRRIVGRMQQLVDDVVRTTRMTTNAGVGRYYPGWRALARSFDDACLAAETGPVIGRSGKVYTPEELGFAELLAENGSVAKDELVRRLLAPLESERELLSTLEVFLQANLSSQVAAQILSIHRHTMAYRLDKIERLTELDPRQFLNAAQFHVALWWRKLVRPSSGTRWSTPPETPEAGNDTAGHACHTRRDWRSFAAEER